MPAPGDPAPARLDAGFADPSGALLLAPARRGCATRVAARAERLRDLTIRQCLSLPFGTLVGAAGAARLAGGALRWRSLGAILTQLLHLALVLAAAPLVVGGIRWLKARMMGRRGASPLQPWRDSGKLLRKRPVLAENASSSAEAAPYAARRRGAGRARAGAELRPRHGASRRWRTWC